MENPIHRAKDQSAVIWRSTAAITEPYSTRIACIRQIRRNKTRARSVPIKTVYGVRRQRDRCGEGKSDVVIRRVANRVSGGFRMHH